MKTNVKDHHLPYSILWLAVVVYAAYFSLYQIQQHRTFQTGLDTASIEQPIWNTLHGHFMRATYYPVSGSIVTDFSDRSTESLLGDHVQPLLLVLALPYLLFPHTETLFITLSVAVALGAVPMYHIAERRLHAPWLALLFAIGYLLLPSIQATTVRDMHATAFLPPLLLAALDAAEREKHGQWWTATLLAMGCREDMPFLIGWAMLWMVSRKHRHEAVAMFGLGIGLSLLYFAVVIPRFGGGSTPYLVRFFPLGTDISPAGIVSVLQQPAFWHKILGTFAAYNVRLGLPLAFLYWLHRPTLLAILPVLLMNGLSWYEFAHYPSLFHYSFPIIPWMLVGAIEGFVLLERTLAARKPTIHWRGLLAEVVGVSIVAAHVTTGYSPIAKGFVWPTPTGRETITGELLAHIPRDAAISTEVHVGAHLSQRETLRFFPDTRNAEQVIIDVWFGGYQYLTQAEVWQSMLGDPNWQTVNAHDGFVVLQRGDGPPKDVLAAFRPSQAVQLSVISAHFGEPGEMLILQGARVFPRSEGPPILCTDWQLETDVPLQPAISTLEGTLRPLDGVQFFPDLFANSGTIRDCTRLMLTRGHTQGITVRLAVTGAEGKSLPVTHLNAENFEGRADVLDGILALGFNN